MARINIDSAYFQGLVPLYSVSPGSGGAGWFEQLDAVQYASINGDLGSTHTTTFQIVFGAGLASDQPLIFSGSPFALGQGLQNFLGSGTRILHGDSDYVNIPSGGYTLYLITNLSDGYDASFFFSNSSGRFYFDPSTGSFLNYAANGNYLGGARLICPMEVHHNATLVNVVFWLTPSASHVAVPESLPTFRVVRVDNEGNVTPLQTDPTTAGWVGDGWVQFNPIPGSFAGWTFLVSFTYAIDIGTIIDTTQYSYFIQINDETGASAIAGNYYHAARAQFVFGDLQPG